MNRAFERGLDEPSSKQHRVINFELLLSVLHHKSVMALAVLSGHLPLVTLEVSVRDSNPGALPQVKRGVRISLQPTVTVVWDREDIVTL